MSDTDRSGALKRKVKDILGDDDTQFSQAFAPYWELFGAMTEDMKIRSFYIRVEEGPSYFGASINACEVAAICDGLLIDLEVHGQGYGTAKGSLRFPPLNAIGSVNLHPGGVQGLRDTQNALLTVTTDDKDLYWFAKTEDEWGYLMDFAQDLIQRIAAG